jgi:hypothetical protein
MAQRLSRQRPGWLRSLPLAGVVLFVGAYFYAASQYPGGSRFDARSVGYDHLANYWCDLLDTVSYNGRANPGRAVAVLATVALPLSLVPLWWELPSLFSCAGAATASVVRVAGVTAMLAAALVFTPLHDVVIHTAVAGSAVAFAATTLGLSRARRWVLVAVGVVAFATGLANYTLWSTGTCAAVTPGVQKAAYAVFLTWVVLLVRALRGQRAPISSGTGP